MKIDMIKGGGTQMGKPAAEDELSVDQIEQASKRFQKDLLYVADNKKMYINEKGYLQKLLELLFETGYYVDNESYFTRKG